MTTSEGIHPPRDPEALGYSWAEWRPDKKVTESDHGYTILRSTTRKSQLGTIQHSIRRAGFDDDVLRVDSYKEGYFCAFWHSNIPMDQFLLATEQFLARFELPPTEPPQSPEEEETEYTVSFFRRNEEPVVYGFSRPLMQEEIRAEGLLDKTNPLTLLRMDTPYGAFTYELNEKRVGVIVVINQQTKQDVISATTEFVIATQPVLSQEVVENVLNRLPYIPTQ